MKINTVTQFFRNITTSKTAKLSTAELKSNLGNLRQQAAKAMDNWQTSGEMDNPWAPPSAETDTAEALYKSLQRKMGRVERELAKRAKNGDAAASASGYQGFQSGWSSGPESHTAGASGKPRQGKPKAFGPVPVAPQESRGAANLLAAILQEPDVDKRAFRIARLSPEYLQSKQILRDIRAQIGSRAAFQQAARKLHPDKVLPHAQVASGHEGEMLKQKTTALWQVFASIKDDLDA